jgi:hypothetical protein
MLALIFALAVADPAAAPAPMAAEAPVAKVSKQDRVTCKWIVNGGGISQHICMTAREWRNDQMERQRRVDDFQRRALTTSPHG